MTYGSDRCCGSTCGAAGNVCAAGGDASACTFGTGSGTSYYEAMPNAQCLMPYAQCPMPNAQCPMPNGQWPMPNALCQRAVFYDLGALAIAFAVQRANAAHAATGGRTTKEFFQSRSKGFWLAVEPFEVEG